MPLQRLTLSELTIRGERPMRAIPVYAALKRRVIADRLTFRVLDGPTAHSDAALLLNLAWWHAGDGGDVLTDASIDADVITHVAWHHLTACALPSDRAPTAAAMFLGESIASAFDLFLVGRFLQTSPRADYLRTQVPAMTDAAMTAGLDEEGMAAILERVSGDPERAFADLRELLFDAATALYAAPTVDAAVAVLDDLTTRPLGPLLHHYALAAWVLYARAYASPPDDADPAVALDRALRDVSSPLAWLTERWTSIR